MMIRFFSSSKTPTPFWSYEIISFKSSIVPFAAKTKDFYIMSMSSVHRFAGQISQTIQYIKTISKQENDDDNYDKRHV